MSWSLVDWFACWTYATPWLCKGTFIAAEPKWVICYSRTFIFLMIVLSICISLFFSLFFFQVGINHCFSVSLHQIFLIFQMQALDTFNTAVVSPIYYVMFTSLTIVASVIMFKVQLLSLLMLYPLTYIPNCILWIVQVDSMKIFWRIIMSDISYSSIINDRHKYA